LIPLFAICNLAELRGCTQFIGLQIEYSLIERTVERELIPMAKALSLGVLALSPLARGVLSGQCVDVLAWSCYQIATTNR
jgi:aryl-alcohol dehydrogenase-like predicted oxidoreductase